MVAALASGSQLRRVIDRAMDSRPGRRGEDVVRLPRASDAGLQSNQARAAWHVYQTYFIATIRMVLNVAVQPGNQTASQYAQPGLWTRLDRSPRQNSDPVFLPLSTLVNCRILDDR